MPILPESEVSNRLRDYVWDVFRYFGTEIYRSWRSEVFASILTAVIAYLVTKDDPQAWKGLVVSVQAGAIMLGLFALWHLLKAPFLIHRETVNQMRVSGNSIFGIFGIAAFFALLCGLFYFANGVLRHYHPAVILTIPLPDPGAKDAEITDLKNQLALSPKCEPGRIGGKEPRPHAAPPPVSKVPNVRYGAENAQSIFTDAPYCKKVILQADINVNPIGLTIFLSVPVKYARITNADVMRYGDAQLDQKNPTTVTVVAKGADGALLRPDHPLLVLVCGQNDFQVLKIDKAIVGD